LLFSTNDTNVPERPSLAAMSLFLTFFPISFKIKARIYL